MLPEWLRYTPSSTLFTFVIASAVSVATSMLNRKLVNREQMGTWQREINRWNADKNVAKKTGDKKLLAKVKKQEVRILQLQSKMFSQQMKTSLITFIPMMIMWQILIGFFGTEPVAYLPGLFEGSPFGLQFFVWYLISSMFSGTLLSRIFGVGMGMGLGMRTSETS